MTGFIIIAIQDCRIATDSYQKFVREATDVKNEKKNLNQKQFDT